MKQSILAFDDPQNNPFNRPRKTDAAHVKVDRTNMDDNNMDDQILGLKDLRDSTVLSRAESTRGNKSTNHRRPKENSNPANDNCRCVIC